MNLVDVFSAFLEPFGSLEQCFFLCGTVAFIIFLIRSLRK